MRQVSRNFAIVCFGSASRLLAVLVVLYAISQPAWAQSQADSASSNCVSSQLNALIVPEGRGIRVNEVKEGIEGKGNESQTEQPSVRASGPFNEHQKEGVYKVFLKEAQQGNPAAMVNLAVSSFSGWGTEPNAGAALYWLRQAADRQYGPALYNLGIVYFKGCGVHQDAAEALHFFDLGAQAGYAPAQVNLGYFYDHGLAVPQDHTAAAHWYRVAAESGEAQAQYNLGDLYLHGEGVPQDEAAAFTWFQKAALQGHAGARIMAGSMLAAGRGTPKDLAAAYFWIFAASLQGDERGASTLQVLEGQLTRAEIEQAKARAQLLSAGLEAAQNWQPKE